MVKVAIVGAGFMGGMHAEVYRNLDRAKLSAVADVDLKKAQLLADKNEASAYSSLEELLSQENIDAVDICLPTFLHKEYVIKAARAGKDILCEKPIALTVEDADEMVQIAKESKVKLMIAQVIRFWREYVELKKIHQAGELGRLLSITLARLGSTPTWAWNDWLTDTKRSGGAFLDLHIHDTDYLLHLLGKPTSLVSRVSSGRLKYAHVFTTFTFPDKVIAFSEGGWDMPDNFPFTMAYTALFEKGTVEFNSRNEKTLAIYRPGKEVEYPSVKPELKSAASGEGNIADLGGYFSEIKYFIDCLENNKEPAKASAQSARDSLEIVLSEMKSAESGKIIEIR
ncbi:MAG TPA: Gfo/Idh/MocA family oxidoreductase [Candidatus Omnitrophica bacterium]|nr:Gfo/Idh/MocA family oxidoreductase [Candidatus Omnitrophota bacterium]